MASGDSWASSDAARRVMQGNRSRDTKPELAVRSLLHRMGLRYRVDRRPVASVPRRADIVFGPARVAVFIDGCYWHACPLHYAPSKTNVTYWADKARRNAARDADTTRRITEAGWTVLRFWEHERPVDVALQIRDAVAAARQIVSRPRAVGSSTLVEGADPGRA